MKAYWILLVGMALSTIVNASEPCGQFDVDGYSKLGRLKEVSTYYVGPAGSKSPNAEAFDCLMQSESRIEFLDTLLQDGDIGGQLYALGGFWLLGSGKFEQEVTRFEGSEQEIRMLIGCVMATVKVGELVDQIKEGNWPKVGAHVAL